MIGIVKLETLRAVDAAMRRTQGWGDAWWSDPEVEEPLRIGQRLGWLCRLSTTQVQWTEAGVEAFREFYESARSRLGPLEDFAEHVERCLVGNAGEGDESDGRPGRGGGTYTVFWSIDVELETGASIEDHARYAAEICRHMDLDDPGGANVFHVAAHDGRAARLLREAGEHATRVDLGQRSLLGEDGLPTLSNRE